MQSKKEQRKTKNILIFKFLFCVFSFAFLVFSANVAYAATLYFSPSSGNFSVGDLLNTGVLVNTQSKSINNADAVINFPSALLEVVSVTKSGSVFSLWVEEPAFSNGAGTISFNGGLPTPGFNGTAGKIINVVFRVKNAGSASLIFSSAAVRANDGYGTDILQTKSQAQFNLVSEERPIVKPAAGTPQAPSVSSPTHPDSNKWYAKSNARFVWNLPSGITADRLLVGRIPTSDPIVLYDPPIDERTVEDVSDGVWYFHVQLRNDSGWGETTHFRFQVDTQKPERFDIRLNSEDPTDPKAKFIFDALDRTSGVDYYEIKIDDLEPEIHRASSGSEYRSPALSSGKHIMIVSAFDKAGNFLTSSAEFQIIPLETPVITEYPKTLQTGQPLIIRGRSVSNAQITVSIQRESAEPKSATTRSDSQGEFSLVYDERLSSGSYKIWAEAADARGARSLPSDKLTFTVEPGALFEFGAQAIVFLVIAIILLSLISVLIYMFVYVRHYLSNLKKKLRKEVHEVETTVHKAFDLLKEDIREQIKLLERARTMRKLTEEEEKIINRLKKHFDEAEKFIEKEIEDIEKEIK